MNAEKAARKASEETKEQAKDAAARAWQLGRQCALPTMVQSSAP